jgi:hypothetical protein
MEIQLSTPKDVVIVKELKKTIETITVLEIVDVSSKKQVIANIKELGSVILWKDAEYDAIGQWTDTDVENKLNELYNS